MRYFIPDSVADEIHERDIPEQNVYGLTLVQAVAIIDAFDGCNNDGEDHLNNIPYERSYREVGTVGILDIDTDGRDHRYGVVFSKTDPDAAKKEAEALLKSWNPDEEDEDAD